LRLSEAQIEGIKKVVFDIFGKSEIYIFGSRVDDSKKGGDIDIYIIPENKEERFKKKIDTKIKLEDMLELPVDVVVHYDFERLIEKEAIKGVKIV